MHHAATIKCYILELSGLAEALLRFTALFVCVYSRALPIFMSESTPLSWLLAVIVQFLSKPRGGSCFLSTTVKKTYKCKFLMHVGRLSACFLYTVCTPEKSLVLWGPLRPVSADNSSQCKLSVAHVRMLKVGPKGPSGVWQAPFRL